MKKQIISSFVIVGLLFLGGCSSNNDSASTNTSESIDNQASTEMNEPVQLSAEISLMKEDAEVAKKSVTFEEGTDLMTIVQESFDVVEDGGMITAIDGIEQDSANSYYWTYTINGEMVNTGASDTLLHDGDTVVFTYAKF